VAITKEEEAAGAVEKSPFGYCHGFIDANYTFLMLNGEDGNADEHFSADQIGVMSATIAFAVMQGLLVVGAIIVRNKLMHRRKFHKTVMLLCVCILLNFVSLILAAAHYSTFAEDGVGLEGALDASRFVSLVSDALFALLLLLLAKGWTIVRRKISADGRVKVSTKGERGGRERLREQRLSQRWTEMGLRRAPAVGPSLGRRRSRRATKNQSSRLRERE
jgi:hypothetical protein